MRALLLALAACGALASRMRKLHDGPLSVYADGDRVLVAPQGCRVSSCMTALPGWPNSFARVSPLAGDWSLVSTAAYVQSSSGYNNSIFGFAVQLASPPRLGCEIDLGGSGCSYEYGTCTSTAVTILPGGDGTELSTRRARTQTGMTSERGATSECTHYVLGPRGCTATTIPCPAR